MADSKKSLKDVKTVCTNRKAYHDYFLTETFEAGISLKGTEVKSLRDGKANLKDSYATIKDGEMYLMNCHISPYSAGSRENPPPTRTRKLLMHRREIERLLGKTKEKGFTLVPVKIYFKKGYAKVELALGKGKKLFDKRRAIKEKESKREIERALKKR
ncbi:MAG: SsrA-binding protein [Candidatus Schekmanbacteria bacterium GWA2_38_11]|uniref:SsrA-binding protein n=1 Tax=Candidatus Schekmanbacteria bacterium GWA2_38_11 TaxID=1817876 RepID=A0A1F7RA53_9BACT|nr:MAG: SsrA-binding protein [Candidatus Schekmanbacteria bacterium GWA2_38_11]